MMIFRLPVLCLGLIMVSSAQAQVPPPATLASPPAGFAIRSAAAPLNGMVRLAQDPSTRNLYALGRSSAGGARVYLVNTAGGSITFTAISAANDKVANAQGMTFDRFGNIYLVGQVDKIVKGVPSGGSFTFSDFLVFNNPSTEHGMGGLVVGSDDKLYFSNGAQTSNGPPQTTIRFGVNVEAKILRMNIDGSGSLEIFASGSRNQFGMTFRADGRLFGVENGPKSNCAVGSLDYGDEFNLITQGCNLGFPDKYGDHISGSDGSLACGTTADIPGLTPAWANNGPNGKPAAYTPFWSFDPHSSPDGISFYEPSRMSTLCTDIKFPSAFNGRAFIARFGELETGITDRGFDVLSLALDDATSSFACNAFLIGMPRPIDVLCAYNGKLYILTYNNTSSGSGLGSGNGNLYEVSYTAAPIVANFTSPKPVGVVPFTASFTDQSTGPVTTWSWDFGDGGTSSVQNPSHVYNQAGTYTVSLTAGGGNCPNTKTRTSYLVVSPPIPADFDRDADVDDDDVSYFLLCAQGPGVILTAPDCQIVDLTGDGVGDQSDFGLLQRCLSGPNVPADPNCAN